MAKTSEKRIAFRVRSDHFSAFRRAASELGLTVSSYFRHLAVEDIRARYGPAGTAVFESPLAREEPAVLSEPVPPEKVEQVEAQRSGISDNHNDLTPWSAPGWDEIRKQNAEHAPPRAPTAVLCGSCGWQFGTGDISADARFLSDDHDPFSCPRCSASVGED